MAQGTYLMQFKSERIRKEINTLEKEMFKVWDNTKSEEYLKISSEIDRLTSEYFKALAEEGIAIPECTINDISKNQ